jgi:hypothetical protein
MGAVWICYDEHIYEISDLTAKLVGTRDEVIARALAGDKECQKILQGLDTKLQQIP